MQFKTFRFLALTGFCLSVLTFFASIVLAQPKQPTLEQLKINFKSPGKEFGTVPFWVWNTKITRREIDLGLSDFKKKNCGGVIVHPRPGLITEYLSDEWNDLFRYTVEQAKKMDLYIWIYDENSYPSGFAGGLVPAQMPESYNQGQMLRMVKSTNLPTDRKDLLIILEKDGQKFKDITKSNQLTRPGEFYLFYKDYYAKQKSMVGPANFPYVDLMVKGVTEKFLEITMKGYEKVAGQEFGKTIPGIFSDEPNLPNQLPKDIRWTPDLFFEFEKKWNYRLQENLPSLFEETGDWQKIRHNYHVTLNQLFIDRWSKPFYAYTQKNNLIWTGHYWEHGWPNPGHVPDNMAMYAWHQQPGIDMLFNRFNEESANAQFGNIRSVKELASVANQLGKKRTLSETYGGAGWDITFKDLKRLGDWQYALGVNFMNQHLSFMSIAGARKYDYPQSFSYHNPWFEHYGVLNQYFARLSLALSSGQQLNKILILEPTTTAWMYHYNGSSGEKVKEVGERFQQFITKLEKAQVEYDLASENIIKDHGSFSKNGFVIGQRTYSTVVIPPGMENIDEPTFKILKQFAQNGGRVLQFQQLTRLDGAVSDDLLSLSSEKFASLTPDIIKSNFQSSGISLTNTGGNIFHNRRQFADGQLLFLANADMRNSATGEIILDGSDVLQMDPFTGDVANYPDSESADKVKFTYNIPPAGSSLFFISEKKSTVVQPVKVEPTFKILPTQNSTIIRPIKNTLAIDFCDVRFADTLLKDQHVVAATATVFKRNGFSRNPWDHQVQYKTEYTDRTNFMKGSGFEASYHFRIDNLVDFKNFTAVVEQAGLWNQILINGNPITPLEGEWWLDHSFGVLNIGPYLQPGANTLTLKIDPMSIFAELGAVYILGDFNLQSAEKGWDIIPPQPLEFGSWKAQGMPMYGETVSYVKKVNLDAIPNEMKVQLGKWEGTVVSVKVNGQNAGIIISEPNSLEISPFIKMGENIIEVSVTGSLKNLLGPNHNNVKPGLADPKAWANIKVYPPGKNYITLDYGLMEDYNILYTD